MSDSDSDNENSPNTGPNLFGMALGIGAAAAAVYAASKIFGSSSSSSEKHSAASRSAKRPGVIDVVQMQHECMRVMNRIERWRWKIQNLISL